MCFTQKTRKLKKLKKNKIFPENKKKKYNISTEHFLRECISCHHCKKCFHLKSNEIKIHCSGCNQFFHCGIAGQCRGDMCNQLTVEGKNHRQSWCIHCVPTIDGNEEKISGKGSCLCSNCLNS